MRDIAELDEVADEIKVCLEKSENLAIRANLVAKSAIEALDRGEFGPTWTATSWVATKIGVKDRQAQRLIADARGPEYKEEMARRKANPIPRDKWGNAVNYTASLTNTTSCQIGHDETVKSEPGVASPGFQEPATPDYEMDDWVRVFQDWPKKRRFQALVRIGAQLKEKN